MGEFFPGKEAQGVAISVVRYKGIFDFDGLYKMMRGWFKEREYDFWERRYKHKQRPGGAELEINWEAWRDITPLIRNWIYIYFHLWDYQEVDVVKDGQKKKMAKARMLIRFAFTMEIDYENRWQDSRFKRAMLQFLMRFVLKKDLDTTYGDKLWYNCNKLQQQTKIFLGMGSHSDVYDDMW